MDKRILIATTGEYPDGMASTYRVHCYARSLAEMGTNIKVVATQSQKLYAGKRVGFSGYYQDIPYTVLWNGNSKGGLKAIFWSEFRSYAMLLYCLYKIKTYDVLWLYNMGLIPRLLLLPLLHLFGKKVVLELNEFPYSTEGNRFTRISVVGKFMKWATLKLVFPQLDGITAISENLAKVVKKEAPDVPVLKVPILVDPARNDIRPAVEGRPHKNPYIFHAGSLSKRKDGIVNVIKAYAKTAKKLKAINDIKFDLVLTNKKTHQDVWEEAESVLKENNLSDNLVITGFLDEAQLFNYMKYSSALLINKPESVQNLYNFPTKLGDYLLSGTPVITASKGIELNKFMKDEENSLVVPPDDTEAMSDALYLLCTDTEKGKAIGAKGRQTALQYFDYKVNSQRIKEFLNSV